MSITITNKELALLLNRLLTSTPDVEDDNSHFDEFMTDIAQVVADYIGGHVPEHAVASTTAKEWCITVDCDTKAEAANWQLSDTPR